jgi:uncharacterized protein
LSAFCAAILSYVFCQSALPLGLYNISTGLYSAVSGRVGPPTSIGQAASPVLTAIQQAALVVLILMVSRLRGGNAANVLRLLPTKGGLPSTINMASGAFIAMALLYVTISVIHPMLASSPPLSPKAFARPELPWLNAATLLIGAPISEEMLIRGFLQSGLTNSRLGFWPAAAAASALWGLMHASEGWAAVAPLFVFGMLLSFILRRGGSLTPCVLAHALNNAVPAISGILH